MTITVKNTERLNKKLDKIAKDIPEEVKKALFSGALLVEGSAKTRIMRGPKTGEVYSRGSKTHQASAPGQAPANDHGILVSSIQHWIKDAGMRIEVGSKLAYAAMLEFGTRKMAARPWLHPSLEENRKKITDLIAQAINKTIRKVKK